MAKRYGVLVLVVLVVLLAGCSSGGKAAVSSSASANATTSLVAHGQATQKVRADLAWVIVNPAGGDNIDFGPNGPIAPSTVPTAKRDKIRLALAQLAIPRTAVHFDTDALSLGDSATTSVRVEIPAAHTHGLARRVFRAVATVLGGTTTHGLKLAVSDCSAVLAHARTKATADAHREALGLARAAHVKLGELRSIDEGQADTSSDSVLALLASPPPCGRASAENPSSSLAGYGNTDGLVRLDATPEVELNFSLSASYALGEPSDRTMTAPGSGDAQGSADQADIVISGSFVGFLGNGPQPVTAAFRARVIARVHALGVPTHDIEVEKSNSGGLAYIRVHVPIAQFRSSGKQIAAAVKKMVGSDAQVGVFFTASNCNDLIQQARVKAVADAGRRIARLATAAKVHAGRIVGLDQPAIDADSGVPIDACHPDFSQFGSEDSLITSISTSFLGFTGGVSLESIDGDTTVKEHVDVSETRAIAS